MAEDRNDWFRAAVQTAWDGWQPPFEVAEDRNSWLYTNVIKPVWEWQPPFEVAEDRNNRVSHRAD